jgi:hypothetical protein
VTGHLTTPAGLVLRPWTDEDLDAVRDAFDAPLMHRQAGLRLPGDTMDDATARQWIALARECGALGTAFSRAVADGPAVLGCAAVPAVDHGPAPAGCPTGR